jgi:hypothetical protein
LYLIFVSPASAPKEKKQPAKESLWFADDIDEDDLKRAYGGGEKVVKEDIVKTMDATTGKDAK